MRAQNVHVADAKANRIGVNACDVMIYACAVASNFIAMPIIDL